MGCCRELLDGEGDDPYGLAGYHVPPMRRDLLADALENMCRSRERRLMMGENGRKRVAATPNPAKQERRTAKKYLKDRKSVV